VTTEALCIVQARTGSSRLPGKVLLDLGGRPVLALLLLRLQRGPFPVVVATSTAPGDDDVARLADALGVDLVRGPEADVLERFRLAVDAWPDADPVVRLTADCPFSDPDVVERAVALHAACGADYTSNTLSRTFPDGLDVEVIARSALLTAAAEATSADEREHVTPFLQRHPDRFRLAGFCSGEDLGDVRLTLDTADDLLALQAAVEAVPDHVAAGWRAFVPARPGPDGLDVRPRCADGLLEARRFAVVVDGQEVAQLVVDLRPGRPAVVEGRIPDDRGDEVLARTSAWLAMDLQRGSVTSLAP
jgi:spore coat polysaccharide biosynthesis protein SpsF